MLKNMKKPLEKCFFAMVVAWRLATDFRGRVFFVARRLATRHVLKTFVFLETLKTSASRLGFGDTLSNEKHLHIFESGAVQRIANLIKSCRSRKI